MGSLQIEARLDVTGPLSDGRAEKAVAEWQRRTSQAIAEQGVAMLREVRMDKSGRATGVFQHALHIVRDSPAQVRIPGPRERGLVWSPWLEGVSRRNESTHFKGYHLFRTTRRRLQGRAAEIGQQQLDELMPQIGGES